MTTETTTYKLDDTTIAGLMQLLALAMATGTNLLDHFRLMELYQNDDGKLTMTDDFIRRTESLAEELSERFESSADDDLDEGDSKDGNTFRFV